MMVVSYSLKTLSLLFFVEVQLLTLSVAILSNLQRELRDSVEEGSAINADGLNCTKYCTQIDIDSSSILNLYILLCAFSYSGVKSAF